MPDRPLPDVLLFVDCETTGLDPDVDMLLEVAAAAYLMPDMRLLDNFSALVNDTDKSPQPDRPSLAENVLAMHRESGLLDQWLTAAAGEALWSRARLAEQFDYLLHASVGEKVGGDEPIVQFAGNSVHFDLAFLQRPLARGFCWNLVSHRQFNVSTLRDAALMWADETMAARVEEAASSDHPHRAYADLQASVATTRLVAETMLGFSLPAARSEP